MTFSDIIGLITAEVRAFYQADDKRKHLLDRVGVMFDTYIEPLNAPGPDALVDPIARAGLIFLAGAMYDAVAKREDDSKPHPPWPALPDTETPTEETKPCDD